MPRRRGGGHLQGARPDAADRRGHARLRRSGHAVRHDDQRVAHLPGDRSHLRQQSVLRVHVPERLGVQPGVDQPDEVRAARTASSTSSSYKAAIRTLITAQEIIVDNASYPTPAIEKNSHAYRPLGLGYANLGALLMSRGLPYDSDGGRDYAAALTALMTGEALRAVGADRARLRRSVRRLREEPRAVPARDAQAPRRDARRQRPQRAVRSLRRRQGVVGRCGGARRGVRLPQRAGDGAGADRHDRLHDGLRHDRRRAGHRAGQVQEAGRRRADEDRQPDGADGAAQARLHAGAGRRDRRLHRRERDDRRRARPQGIAPAGVRLRVQGGARASGRSTTWATSR